MKEIKFSPADKYLIFSRAAIMALQVVKDNYAADKYDKENWFPLGASYFGVKGVRGKALQALTDNGFRTAYDGGVKLRMPAGQSANVGDQMADDYETAFKFWLETSGYTKEVNTFTDAWYN